MQDFFSIPQLHRFGKGSSTAAAARAESDIMKAARSFPVYLQRCTHFFAVCPTILHKDLPGEVCNFGSWLQRGWCNFEYVSLAPYSHLHAWVRCVRQWL